MDDTDAVAFELARQMRRRRRRRKPAARAAGMTAQPEPVSDTQRRGGRAEARALEYLRQQGLVLVAANLRCRAGELDLIMRDGKVLVFVEVRARCSGRFGGAAASVDHLKRRRLLQAAAYFLAHAWRGAVPRCRFDVVAFDPHGCLWLRDAFRGDVR